MSGTSYTPGKLHGQFAVITGGGSGIGRGIAHAFVREGAWIAIIDRDYDRGNATVTEVTSMGGSAEFFSCNVDDPQQVSNTIETISRGHPIDVLVNNAGITTTARLADLSVEQWNETIGTDLTGVFLMTQAVVPHMEYRGGGRIINIASQLGLRGAAHMAHYCAAKAGVIGFTRACARELVGKGILVNAVAPGPTRTENLEAIPRETTDSIRAELPIGRFADVGEIVPTVILLASSDGDYYVGATLNLSGGHVM